MSRLDTLATHLESDLFVHVERRGEFGILSLRHRAPHPASDAALTAEMRRSLLHGLRTLQADATVTAILLTSDSPRVFSSGVNRESFGDALIEDTERQIPSLAALCDAVESSPKIVVAYLQGSCSSWGLELAMAAPFRVALRSARFSFPEVQLSLVPCGGGTQRLTRLIGVRQSLLMLCSGKTVTAGEALTIGLVDKVVWPSSPPVTAASGAGHPSAILCEVTDYVAACVAHAARFTPFIPRARRGGRIGMATANAVHLAWMEHKLREYAPRNVRAPYQCLHAVRIAVRYAHDFAAGLAQERQLFLRCLLQAECKAMQHVLRASSRTLANWEGRVRASLTVREQLRPFRHAAVIGAGLIGTSVAFLLLQHGLEVTLVELDAGRQALVKQRLTSEVLAAAEAHKRISLQEARDAIGRLHVCGSHLQPLPSNIADVDLVVECVSEFANVKKNVFAQLDTLCNAECVFVTCASSVDVTELAAVTQRAPRVLGLQFYPPANMNPLVELSCTPHTDVGVLRRILALAEKLQKHVILTRSTVGRAGTCILLAGLYQAYTMLEEGAFPIDVDRAMKEHFHFKMGIFELEDLVGLDATALARQQLQQLAQQPRGASEGRSSSSPSSAALSPLMQRDVYTVVDTLVSEGHVGRKRGEGWHKYKEVVQLNPERDAKDDETPLKLPSLSESWNPMTWRSGTLLPQGQWQALLSTHDLDVAHNRAPEHCILRVSKAKKIMRRDITANEVVDRINLAMINESAKLLAAGVVACASDVDCLSVHVFGFPAWQGGLMYYADHVLGVDTIIKRMKIYHSSVGSDAFPASCEVLLEMSRKRQTFASTFAYSHNE